MPFSAGQSAVVVPVPAAEPLVGPWRERFDTSARMGMPAHVTTLFPFLHADRLTDAVVAELSALCAAAPPMEVRFTHVGRFPVSVYLAPEPSGGLRELTLAIYARWPEAPPFKGRHAEVIPHLTVAFADGETLDEIEASVARCLPIHTRLEEAALYVFDGTHWQARARLPFAA